MRSMTLFARLVMALAILCAGVGPAFGANRRPLVIISGQTQTLPAATGLQTSAATTANPSINLPPGTAPTSPADGDVWFTSAGMYIRVAGSTVGPLSAGGSPGGSSGQIQYNNAGAFGGANVSGDCSASVLAFTCTKTSGVSFGYFATGTDAANLTGTVSVNRFNSGTGASSSTFLRGDGTWAAAGSGTVTHTGALTSGQLVFGNGTADVVVGDLSGAVTTSGSGATTYAGTVPVNKGGTGQTSYTDGQLLIGNSSGNTLTKAVLTPGSGVSISNSGGAITISATGAAVPTTSLSPPQGRLTLVTGVPVMSSDQTAKTHVYYTPYVGAVVPVYSGSAWALTTLSGDLDMALDTSNQLTENVYDLYVWNGGASIGAGPAWSNAATITVTIATPAVVTWTGHGLYEGAPVIFTNSGGALPTGITAGTTYYVGRSPATNTFNISTSVANAAAGTLVATSGSQSGTHTGTNHTTTRGTGAGTSELQMLNGIWTNKNSITLKNGAGGGTAGIAANTATYVGSAYMTANGQTGMSFQPATAAGGPSPAPVLGLWNAFNRVPVSAAARDSTISWTYATATWRSANNSVLNRAIWLDGLGISSVRANYNVTANGVTGATAAIIGINLNNTTRQPFNSAIAVNSSSTNITTDTDFAPTLGVNYAQAVEYSTGATSTFQGLPTSTIQTMQLVAKLEM